MAKMQRVVDNRFLNSGLDVVSIEYNPAAGAQKSLIVGPRYLAIPIVSGGASTWTTNVATATALPYLGANLAIFNNTATVQSVTVGQNSTVTSQAPGAFDANGNVGVALPPYSYTYLSMGYNQWIISSASTVIVYIIEDPTYIVQESGPYAQQNPAGSQPVT